MADQVPPAAPPSSNHPPPAPEAPEADSPVAPAPEAVPSVKESDLTVKEEIDEPSASEEMPPHPETVELAGSESKEVVEKEAPLPPPQAVATESKSLSVMMEKDESRTESQETHKSAADTTQKEAGVADEEKNIVSMASFKEESNKISDLSDSERKALQELKQLVQEALDTHQFTSPAKPEKLPEENLEKETAKSEAISAEEVSIWGIPLLKDDRSDVIFLKFLRARDFKVKDAFIMIKNTIQWRKDFDIDELVDEDLGNDLEKVVFMQGHDREGHPVCYNVFGEFQNKELYQKAFSDEEKRMKFLRWRIQFLERSIRKLDFSPGGVCSIFQINDLQNSPGPGKRELRLATKQALQLLQDNYPEFVAKQVFINVPWWYLAFYTMMSPFMTQRTKSKFVFAGPTKSAESLFKYISPEQVPIQYGGLGVDFCDCNPEFSIDDPATEITVKPGTKQTVEIAIYEKCVLVWELRVVGWDVSYGAEFVPNAKDNYTVIIQKPTKMAPRGEPVVSHTFNVSELGKVLLTVDNPTSKKKLLLYRFIVKPFSD